MTKFLGFFLALSFLSSCSVYSSAGRKQFENKSPDFIQAFSLMGCRQLSQAEAWLKAEFPSRNSELIEMHSDYEVWSQGLANGKVEISVYSKSDSDKTDLCTYQFESAKAWLDHKSSFLEELSRSLVNID